MDSATQGIDLPNARLHEIQQRMQAGTSDGIAELEALLAKHPYSRLVIGPLAWAYANAGRHEDSIALNRRYVELEPENPEMYWRIGDRYINLARLDEAERAYRDALDRFPDSLDARMGVRYVAYLRRNHRKDRADIYKPSRRQFKKSQRKNARLNRREYRQEYLKLESLPPSLFLESTTKCNFFCKTCSKGYAPYHAEDLEESVLEMTRAQLMPTNVRISITGFGEPTLAGNFDEILEMAVANGSKVQFVTNASLLNFERIERITRHPVHITISIDGATRETFERIRAGSNFDLTLEKLAMIKKLRDIYMTQITSSFSFNFVALRSNIHELPEVIRLAHHFGILQVNVADYGFNSNAFDSESLQNEPEKANGFLVEAQRVAAELGVRLTIPTPYADSERNSKRWRIPRILPDVNRFPRRCSSPWSEPYIETDGRVRPCCASGQHMGHLRENDFRTIWNGWRYRLLRWRIHSQLPPNECRKCFVNWGINGGNHGAVMAREGLLIKGLYRLERLAVRRIKGIIRFVRARRTRHSSAPVDAGQPNYYLGRPYKPD